MYAWVVAKWKVFHNLHSETHKLKAKIDINFYNKKCLIIFTFIVFIADIALWNSNGSSVDVFLKKSAIDGGAGDFLRSTKVGYSIVINDMQKEIENENPPKAEIELLQDRKGNTQFVTWTAL